MLKWVNIPELSILNEWYVCAGSQKMRERVNDINWLKKEAYEVTRHKEVVREPNEDSSARQQPPAPLDTYPAPLDTYPAPLVLTSEHSPDHKRRSKLHQRPLEVSPAPLAH